MNKWIYPKINMDVWGTQRNPNSHRFLLKRGRPSSLGPLSTFLLNDCYKSKLMLPGISINSNYKKPRWFWYILIYNWPGPNRSTSHACLMLFVFNMVDFIINLQKKSHGSWIWWCQWAKEIISRKMSQNLDADEWTLCIFFPICHLLLLCSWYQRYQANILRKYSLIVWHSHGQLPIYWWIMMIYLWYYKDMRFSMAHH